MGYIEDEIIRLVSQVQPAANDPDAVKITNTNQNIDGVKTFLNAPGVPNGSFAQAKVTNLTTDLAERMYMFDPGPTGVDDVADTAAIVAAFAAATADGYTYIKFPREKTFLITPVFVAGVRWTPSIVVPSGVTIDLNGSTLKMKPNDLVGYVILGFEKDTKHTRVTNGKLQGDKAEHTYVQGGPLGNSHEWGYGVEMRGQHNTLDHLEISGFTGDGVYSKGYNDMNWDDRLFDEDFTVGDIDASGVVTATPATSIVSGLLDVNTYTENKTTNLKVEPYYGSPPEILYAKIVKVVFYQNGAYLNTVSHLAMTEVNVPVNATHFRIVFLNSGLPFADTIFVHANLASRYNKITNCTIFDCRRQGISASNFEGSLIEDVEIYDIGGTLPGAGIDIEDARFTTNNLTIRRVKIHRTFGSCIVAFEGYNIKIEDSTFIGYGPVYAVGATYVTNMSVTGCTIYGAVTVGSTSPSVNKKVYNRDSFHNNIVIGIKSSAVRSFFQNSSITECTFTDMGVSAAADSTFERCKFDDTETKTGYARMQLEGNFENCVFTEAKSSSRAFEAKGTFTNCVFNGKELQLTNYLSFVGNTVNTENYTMTSLATGGRAYVQQNKFLGQKSTAMMMTFHTDAVVSDNYFALDAAAWYTNVNLVPATNCTRIYLSRNLQEANGLTASAYRLGGANGYAWTLWSEDNTMRTSGVDWQFADALTAVKVVSKDDHRLGTASADARVNRIYSDPSAWTFTQAAPDSLFRLPWNGTAWTWKGTALAARPSARTDIYFDLYGAPAATADPAWILSNDSRTDV